MTEITAFTLAILAGSMMGGAFVLSAGAFAFAALTHFSRKYTAREVNERTQSSYYGGYYDGQYGHAPTAPQPVPDRSNDDEMDADDILEAMEQDETPPQRDFFDHTRNIMGFDEQLAKDVGIPVDETPAAGEPLPQ